MGANGRVAPRTVRLDEEDDPFGAVQRSKAKRKAKRKGAQGGVGHGLASDVARAIEK